MKKKTMMLAACIALTTAAYAQEKNGGISARMLQQIQQTNSNTPAAQALANALSTNSIDDLVKNRSTQGAINTYFSDETPKQNIQDQKKSGRCWMFTGFNVLRADYAQRSGDRTVEYSHAYLFFWDQLEKSNLMLQGVIDCAKLPLNHPDVVFFFKNPLSDGGTFCGVMDLVDKYGLVPQSVMPESYSAENTARIARLISSKLREFGLELRGMVKAGKKSTDIQNRKTQMLATVYKMLSMTLGEPVKTFQYAFTDKNGKAITPMKTYTPMEFYKETVGEPLTGRYIMVMNDPRHPYYKTYEIDKDRHTYDGQNWLYLNLPMDEISTLAIASIKAGHKMYSSYDVGKQLDRTRGYLDLNNFDYASLFDTSFNMSKADRISTFESGSTHAMTLTAVDLDANGKPLKWKVENSWGESNGAKGYLIMTNDWFNEYMFRLVVDKKVVPERIVRMAEQKPMMLTYDDPLFGEDQ